jgi:tRNA nucleotidyltransferase (CCA-adding enzyme)
MDVVVEGDAVALARAAVEPGEPAPVLHVDFGTATLVSGATRVDLVTARAESYHWPGALPAVRAGDIHQDLARRDFSIHAMALVLNGERRGDVLDPHGGRGDLEHGLLRVLHEQSFIDDATRMLRGVRYEQRFGFAFEPRTLSLLERDLTCLDTISGDRVRHELERTFDEAEPEQALQRLDVLRLLSALHPGLRFGPEKARALAGARREPLSTAQLQGVSWCLLGWGMDAAMLESLRVRLTLRRSIVNDIADALAVAGLEMQLDRPDLEPSAVFDLLHGRSHVALLTAGLLLSRPAARRSIALYLSRLRHVRPALAGEDLRQLGFSDGPAMGDALTALRAARLNGEVASRADEVELARRLLGTGGR